MQKKALCFFASLVLIAVALFACTARSSHEGGDGEGGVYVQKPASRGLPFELVVIIPEGLYTGELRDSLDALTMASTPVLPQHEPMFRTDMVWADANLTPWRTMRLRLVVKIDRRTTTGTVGVARNTVAVPQTEVLVSAANAHELALTLGRERERISDILVDSELNYMAAALRRKYSAATAEAVRELVGRDICVPPALKASKRAKDFLWTGTNLNDRDQNFVCYTYPWDGCPLSSEQFVAKRDSALRANIPGATSNQWMQTAREGGQPLIVSRARIINNEEVLEVHGLWEMHDGALGGPFVAIEHIDSARRRVIATEGFIYSPHSPKRPILREMEAALRTWK